MAQIGDFFARMFTAGGTRGLSGDADLVLPPERSFDVFNGCLRRHQTVEDFVGDPSLIWDTPSLTSRRGGLRQHLAAVHGEGDAPFTDVLVIVNKADWQRAQLDTLEPWQERAFRVVDQELSTFRLETGFRPFSPHRPIGLRFVADGGPEMGGATIGLVQGEFVTGLLPNLYIEQPGQPPPVLAVHLNVPGAWEGYREVGRVYADQALFTLGSHWLDNFHHAALAEPALYRLQRQDDGTCVHAINPDLQDAYRIVSDGGGEGASVVAIEDKTGEPLAYLVLAMVGEDLGEALSGPVEPAAPVVAEEVEEAPPAPPVRDERPPVSFRGTTSAPGIPDYLASNRTVLPTEVEERILTLREQGALLQRVHFNRFMEGYDVFIGNNGQVGTAIANPAATIQVRGSRVSLIAHVPDLTINGVPCPPEMPIGLSGDSSIALGTQTLAYRDLGGVDSDGWPYLGEIRRPASTVHMVFGNRYRIGRDRSCKVRLPDEPHNNNIVWHADLDDGGVIRSRTGDIPKSRFYTDSIMVASKHAEIDLFREPIVVSLARHCYTYVRRGREILALAPTTEKGGPTDLELQSGDELLIGNCVFSVGYPPAVEAPVELPRAASPPKPVAPPPVVAAPPPPAPPPLVATPPPPAPPPPPPPRQALPPEPPSDEEVPAAVGLGERGPAPAAPYITVTPADSILGVDLPPGPFPPPSPARPHRPSLDEHLADVPDPTAAPDRSPEDFRAGGRRQVVAPPAEPRSVPPAPRLAVPDLPVGEVVAVDESSWQFELSRPARLVLVGWMVSGDAVVGNHDRAPVIVPENRAVDGQLFAPTSYLRLQVRGRRVKADLLAPGECRLVVNGAQVQVATDPDALTIEIVRRDPDGEEDFVVPMVLVQDPSLPDPRARLLAADTSDQMVRALFTTGLPLRAARDVNLGEIRASATYDGDDLVLRDYLATYRRSDGTFRPFFVRRGVASYQTVPEDGQPLTLRSGDTLISGIAVFQYQR